MKYYKRKFSEVATPEDIESEMYSLKKQLRKKMPAASDDAITIKAAKEVAKLLKLKVKDILQYYTPNRNIQRDKYWDKEGNIR